jgi:predicted flap endonuclease-1-like 5' DNA nuclease
MKRLALAVLLFAAPAAASVYPLDQVTLIIPRADAARLRRVGLESTLDLLTYGRTAPARRLLAERTRLAVEKIDAWVALADLMRVRGIGPDVARLLTAVGVRTLADLQNVEPVSTAQAIVTMNKQRRLSQNPPGAESLAHWVGEARRLPIVLE